MQGRLTPSLGRGVQFSLKENEWLREFELARDIGVSHIQWVGDYATPLFEHATQQEINDAVARTGVSVRNIDLHELLTKKDVAQQEDGLFEKICASIAAVKGGTVELPMVEASSLLDPSAYPARIAALRRVLAIAQKHGVPVAVETDLPPQALKAFSAEVPDVGIVWDVGNSAGLGYDMQEEMAAYGSRITDVHIKDKPLGGTTVPLGQGSVDFVGLFAGLRSLAYTGAVVLQAARGEDGKEGETIKAYAQFIQDAYEKSI